MENSKLELDTVSLDEHGKVATSLEDIYGYQVLSEEFEKQVNQHKELEEQERKQYMEYVFTENPTDTIMAAFDTVMEAQTNVIVGTEYSDKEIKGDSPIMIIGFTLLGAVLTGIVLLFIEKIRKGKKNR